jgi:hypothetical protein
MCKKFHPHGSNKFKSVSKEPKNRILEFKPICIPFPFWSSPPLIKSANNYDSTRIFILRTSTLSVRFPFGAVQISLCCFAVYFASRIYISLFALPGGVILYAHTSTVCPCTNCAFKSFALLPPKWSRRRRRRRRMLMRKRLTYITRRACLLP